MAFNVDLLGNQSASITDNFLNRQQAGLNLDKQAMSNFAQQNKKKDIIVNIAAPRDNTKYKIDNAISRNYNGLTGEIDQKGVLDDLYRDSPQIAMQYAAQFKKDNAAAQDRRYQGKVNDINLEKGKLGLVSDRVAIEQEKQKMIMENAKIKEKNLEVAEKGLKNLSNQLFAAGSPQAMRSILMSAASQGIDVMQFTGGKAISKMTDDELMEVKKSATNMAVGAVKTAEMEYDKIKDDRDYEMKKSESEADIAYKQAQTATEVNRADQVVADTEKKKAETADLTSPQAILEKDLKIKELEENIKSKQFTRANEEEKRELDSRSKKYEARVKERDTLIKAAQEEKNPNSTLGAAKNAVNNNITALEDIVNTAGGIKNEKGEWERDKDGNIILPDFPEPGVKFEAALKAGALLPNTASKLEAMFSTTKANQLLETLTAMKAELGSIGGAMSNKEGDVFSAIKGISGNFKEFIRRGDAQQVISRLLTDYEEIKRDYERQIKEFNGKKGTYAGRLKTAENNLAKEQESYFGYLDSKRSPSDTQPMAAAPVQAAPVQGYTAKNGIVVTKEMAEAYKRSKGLQ